MFAFPLFFATNIPLPRRRVADSWEVLGSLLADGVVDATPGACAPLVYHGIPHMSISFATARAAVRRKRDFYKKILLEQRPYPCA